MFSFGTCNAVAAGKDRKPKYWRLGRRHLGLSLTLWRNNNHKSYSRCRVWHCDATTSNSIQDGGALVENILVFDHRVQLQHCTYQRKTLLFALIKVGTFICKRELLGCSSPLILKFSNSNTSLIPRNFNFWSEYVRVAHLFFKTVLFWF